MLPEHYGVLDVCLLCSSMGRRGPLNILPFEPFNALQCLPFGCCAVAVMSKSLSLSAAYGLPGEHPVQLHSGQLSRLLLWQQGKCPVLSVLDACEAQ